MNISRDTTFQKRSKKVLSDLYHFLLFYFSHYSMFRNIEHIAVDGR